ncbi:GNAT family N-acetyltransferase [Trinickia sp. LjRoot230]|uniref:GNAT family N-acetyltransferase n=1 Tax=Trinickia sp. LjRoot230 TaxID=3342288 RepID=UPI003ECC713E
MSEIVLKAGRWPALGADATRVRNAVFAQEQRIAAPFEWDETDLAALHVVAFDIETDKNKDEGPHIPIAAGRLLPEGAIGRLAVLCGARRRGIGSRVLQTLIAHAVQRGDAQVRLYAQCQVVSFYERHGFATVGDMFEVAGIPHIEMVRGLSADRVSTQA